jgi:hypothetical protein
MILLVIKIGHLCHSETLENNDPDSCFLFSVEERNAAHLVNGAIRHIDGLRDHEETNFFDETLKAFDWFESTVGIDFHSIEERWHEIGIVFLPPAISNHYGVTERRNLFRYLEEVHSCYIHGNALAGLLLSRALLKRVLKEHYLPRIRPDLTQKRIGIEQLIKETAKAFESLDSNSFESIRVTANSVAHSFSELDQEHILDFRGDDNVALRNAIGILEKFLAVDPSRLEASRGLASLRGGEHRD